MEGKFKSRSKMETIVWWSRRGESLIEEVKWRPLYGGAEGGESLIEEVKRRPLYAGAHNGNHCMVEPKGREVQIQR